MRESDAILAADLRDLGQEDLAVRAESGEWNDYFGQHTLPQTHLMHTLKEHNVHKFIYDVLINNALNGKYDSTEAEADEWAASDEGQEAFASFFRKKP